MSSKDIRRPGPDPVRKIRFREAAREIVAKDRQDRKYGFAVDTAGAIARAMERAYRQGFEEAQRERPISAVGIAEDNEAVAWGLIPPRPRSAFWSICLFILGKTEQTDGAGHLLPVTTERGTPGWQVTVPSRPLFDKVVGEKTIMPLVRLGLLELAGDRPERLLISARGTATWWLFLQRGGQYPEDLTLL